MNATRFRDMWRRLEPRGQLTIGAAVLAVVVTAYLLFSFAGNPSYTVVAAGLNPADTAQIVQALDAAGISNQIQNGGTQVAVKSGSEAQARIALASKNLPNGGQVGFEIFNKQPLGATDFQQQVNYQRALEGEIARQIQMIAGVRSADVQLVIPQDTIFADQSSKASAAVLLTDGGALDASAVSSIAHLVASAVKGLDPENVTITDDTGALVWPTSDSAGGLTAASKLRAEQLYSSQLAAQINAMLVSTLGPGKAQARVQADLNVDQTTVDKVTYAKKGTPLTTSTSKETLASKGGAAVPAAGTASNVPTYATGAAGANGSSNYLHQTSATEYGVNKVVQRTTVAPGSVNKLDVALLLDSSIPAAQAAQIRQSVAALAGITPARGDTISVSSVAFAAQPKAVKASPLSGLMSNPLGLVKPVLIAFAAIVFLFTMRRSLKRRETEGVAPEPTWLREFQSALPIAELTVSKDRDDLNNEATANAERRKALRAEAEEIALAAPEELAAQVGAWVKD